MNKAFESLIDLLFGTASLHCYEKHFGMARRVSEQKLAKLIHKLKKEAGK